MALQRSTLYWLLTVVQVLSVQSICPYKLKGGCCEEETDQGSFDYVVRCPFIDNKFSVHVDNGERAEMSCQDSTTFQDILERWDSNLLKVGNITRFKMTSCPLPEASMKSFLKDVLGVTGVQVLTISYARGDFSSYHVSNFEELRYLYLDNLSTGGQRLDSEYFSGLPNLKRLEMEGISNTKFAHNMFHELTANLGYLEVSRSKWPELAPDQFAGLTGLKYLNLYESNIIDLPKEIFADLKNLTMLNLKENGLTGLPEGIFDSLEELETINLSMNHFTQLPENLFKQNAKLERITWIQNRGAQCHPEANISDCAENVEKIDLPATLFQIPSLKSLKILHFPVTGFPETIFKGAKMLENVTIQTTYSGGFPENIFSDCTNMKRLDLVGNLMKNVSANMFSSMDQLIILELHTNLITSLPAYIFKNQEKLEVLDLRENLISKIDRKVFSPLKRIQRLDLSKNSIVFTENSESIFGGGAVYQRLEWLNLAHNHFSYLEENIKTTFLSLTTLDLTNNSFRKLTAQDWMLNKYSSLEVNLSYNKIETVDFVPSQHLQFIAQNSTYSKVVLKLTGNPLFCDCRMTEMKRLLEGSLDNLFSKNFQISDGDRLTCSSKSSPEVKNRFLQDVDYSDLNCPFPSDSHPDSCPRWAHCWYNRYTRTIILQASVTNLTSMPMCLPVLKNEKEEHYSVNLWGNKIANITNARKQMIKRAGRSGECGTMTGNYDDIKFLNLSENLVTSLENTSLPDSLIQLDLSGNMLTELPDSEIDLFNEKMERNFSLLISGNPFSCSCDSEYLYKFASNRSKRIPDINDLILNCSPRQQKSLIRLSLEDFCSYKLTVFEIVAIVVAMLFLVMLTFMVLFYSCYKDSILVWLYAKEWFRFLFDDELLDSDKPYDAFISYSHHDNDFVTEVLRPGLESPPPEESTYKYKCLIHERDWIVGQPIPDNILNSVQSSRRTIIVLSKNFIKSMWSSLEFQAAHTQALHDKTQRVVIILHGDLPNEEEMPSELNNYIKLNTYIESESPWFWERLRYALPHRGSGGILSARRRRRTRRETDQLELIREGAMAGMAAKDGARTPSPPTISAMVDSAEKHLTKLPVIDSLPADHLPTINYTNGKLSPKMANGNGVHQNGGGMNGLSLNDAGRQMRQIITAQN